MTPGRPASSADTSWPGAVPRRLVHKQACAEVYLTSWRPSGPHACEVGAQWPPRHGFYHVSSKQDTPHHDLLLAAETLRQAVICSAHQLYDVPLTNNFAMKGLTVQMHDAGPPVESSASTTENSGRRPSSSPSATASVWWPLAGETS
jgi:hypothetical protein